jgi:exosome complex RNA-binding protein Rrp4
MITKIQDKMALDYVNLEKITPAQLMTLRIAEENGWALYFVRQDCPGAPVVGIMNTANKAIGVIDESGNYVENSSIRTRINPEFCSIF